jgi:hypothetical protein
LDAGEVRADVGGRGGLGITVASRGAVIADWDYSLDTGKIETKVDDFGQRDGSVAVAVCVYGHAGRDFGLDTREVEAGIEALNFDLDI